MRRALDPHTVLYVHVHTSLIWMLASLALNLVEPLRWESCPCGSVPEHCMLTIPDDVRPVVDRSYNEILLLKFRAVNTKGLSKSENFCARFTALKAVLPPVACDNRVTRSRSSQVYT